MNYFGLLYQWLILFNAYRFGFGEVSLFHAISRNAKRCFHDQYSVRPSQFIPHLLILCRISNTDCY